MKKFFFLIAHITMRLQWHRPSRQVHGAGVAFIVRRRGAIKKSGALQHVWCETDASDSEQKLVMKNGQIFGE